MTWNAPATATGSQVVSPGFWNNQIRDNLLETDAGKATTPGDTMYATGANALARLGAAAGKVLASDGSVPVWRAQEAFMRLTGSIRGDVGFFVPFDSPEIEAGPIEELSVTLTTGPRAIVWFGARFVYHNTLGNNVQLSYQVSGATTIAASNTWGTVSESDPAGTLQAPFRAHYVTGLNTGSNKFELMWLAAETADEAVITDPWIMVRSLQ